MRHRFTAGLIATTIGVGLLTVGAPRADASSKGRKNTSLGLGAAAIYELLRGNTTTGLIAGAGTAYAYKRYRDARNDERRYGRYDGRTRSSRSRYRTRDNGSSFQFPESGDYRNGSDYTPQYSSSYGKGGNYSSDGYQYQNGGYSGSGGYYRNDGYQQNDAYQYRGSRYSADRDGRSRYDDDRVAGYRSQQDGENCPRRGRGHSARSGHWRRD